jgi:hypothetical protein
MIYSLFFNVLAIGFLCFCLTRLTNVLCKIVAAIYIALGALNVLWYFGLFIEIHHLVSMIHIGAVGMILRAGCRIQLHHRGSAAPDACYFI